MGSTGAGSFGTRSRGYGVSSVLQNLLVKLTPRLLFSDDMVAARRREAMRRRADGPLSAGKAVGIQTGNFGICSSSL